MAGGDNGRRRVSGDETKNEVIFFILFFTIQCFFSVEKEFKKVFYNTFLSVIYSINNFKFNF